MTEHERKWVEIGVWLTEADPEVGSPAWLVINADQVEYVVQPDGETGRCIIHMTSGRRFSIKGHIREVAESFGAELGHHKRSGQYAD